MADPAYIVDGVLTDGEAWVGIGTTTLGVDTAVVTFTSTDDGQVGDFSQYMDLVLVSYVRTDRNGGETEDQISMHLNNDASTDNNYTVQRLLGTGAAVYGATYDSGTTGGQVAIVTAFGATANVFSAVVTHLFDVNSGKYKSWLSQGASDTDGAGYAELYGNIWKSQAPITEIDLTPTHGSNWEAGSMFSLFGVLPRMVA